MPDLPDYQMDVYGYRELPQSEKPKFDPCRFVSFVEAVTWAKLEPGYAVTKWLRIAVPNREEVRNVRSFFSPRYTQDAEYTYAFEVKTIYSEDRWWVYARRVVTGKA